MNSDGKVIVSNSSYSETNSKYYDDIKRNYKTISRGETEEIILWFDDLKPGTYTLGSINGNQSSYAVFLINNKLRN